MSGELVPSSPADGEIADIERTMREDSRAYWTNPDMQKRYGELLEARQSGTPASARRSGASQERKQLETMMRDRYSAYWRGPDAERHQARYRELLDEAPETSSRSVALPQSAQAEKAKIEAAMKSRTSEYWVGKKDASGHTQMQRRYGELLRGAVAALRTGTEGEGWRGEAWRATPNAALAKLPSPVVSVLGTHDGLDFERNLVKAQDAALRVVGAIGDEQVAESFAASFEELPGSAQAAVFHELVAQPHPAAPAGDGELGWFKTIPGVSGMIQHWGAQAAYKVGMIADRFNRMLDGMTGPDREASLSWWRSISDQERAAVLWALGGSA